MNEVVTFGAVSSRVLGVSFRVVFSKVGVGLRIGGTSAGCARVRLTSFCTAKTPLFPVFLQVGITGGSFIPIRGRNRSNKGSFGVMACPNCVYRGCGIWKKSPIAGSLEPIKNGEIGRIRSKAVHAFEQSEFEHGGATNAVKGGQSGLEGQCPECPDFAQTGTCTRSWDGAGWLEIVRVFPLSPFFSIKQATNRTLTALGFCTFENGEMR
jgi:hypothetical protein